MRAAARRLDRLPEPQQAALRTAFGQQDGGPPARFLVALAVLSLLAEAAEERPLFCLIDDAQWLDRATAQALGFVARRLLAERIALVFAVREPSEDRELAGLPELLVEGLGEEDARRLLASAIRGRVDERVRDRIIAEARGNPLALLELPRGLAPEGLAGGYSLPDAKPLAGQIEQSFLRRLEPLPRDSQRLVLTAAAEPVGDVTLLWRAAERLGIGAEASVPAEAAGLMEIAAPGAVPASAGALRRLPGGDRARAPGGPSRAGRGHGPGRRPRSPRLASRPRGGGSRRGGGRRAGALGRPSAAPQRARGGRRVPPARRRADARSGQARRPRAGSPRRRSSTSPLPAPPPSCS